VGEKCGAYEVTLRANRRHREKT